MPFRIELSAEETTTWKLHAGAEYRQLVANLYRRALRIVAANGVPVLILGVDGEQLDRVD
jgi:phosphoglucomutase